ncbi:T9SS type A sorting domain-containing protein [Pustulibacterium marinum]|nr:T9SS type A sorting domain-containing protein [Pustulibacterium marinum]
MKKLLLSLCGLACAPLMHAQIANQGYDLMACDTAPNDGMAVFDLSENSLTILGTQAQEDYAVTYYTTQTEADAGVNSIVNPMMYTNMVNPQTIYARVTSYANGAYATSSFDITVYEVPIINTPTPLEACDDDLDGFAMFNLEAKIPEIVVMPPDAQVLFYYSEADAMAEINTLVPATAFLNMTPYTQTVYVNVKNPISGCYSITTLDLIALDCTDTDADGVLDSAEDLNGNGNLEDDDTDLDNIPNYMDADDDGDWVPTLVEVTLTTGLVQDLHHTVIDTDGDLIENYLDNDDDNDTILTIYEDYNGNGDPTDDDTDENGVPDYLQYEVATMNVVAVSKTSVRIYPNPATEVLYIENLSAQATITVVDLQGRTIHLNVMGDATTGYRLPIAVLNTGVYTLYIQDEDHTSSIQFVKTSH